jgi:MauM/NapG family ferredoxin protein
VTPAPSGKPEHSGRNRLRQTGRWLVLLAAVTLAWPLRTESSTAVFLPALSPFVALNSALSARAAGTLTLLAAPVLLLALVFPRWFCRHGCPVGLLQERLERLRPTAPRPWQRWPAIGQWLVLLTLGGAGLGYPLFLWLDPLALFHGFLNGWRQPLALATLLTGLGLPLVLVLDLAFPRLWCRRLCPLGATQELLAWPRRRLRQSGRCDEELDAPGSRSRGRGRRWFLAVCAGAAGAFAIRKFRGQLPPPLRPPGALEEDRFAGVCLRCGNCAQACPSRIIQPDWGASGVAGLFTPRLRFDDDYCREDCHRCGMVCPSGAIVRLSLPEKRRRVLGPAKVDRDTCLLANGRECIACIQRCPYHAIVRHSADGGFTNAPAVDLAKCTGCGACEAACPVRPERAIQVVARPGHLNDNSSSLAETLPTSTSTP